MISSGLSAHNYNIGGCVTRRGETEIVATAGQTDFALPNAPSGEVWFYRNGIRLPLGSVTATGSLATYDPTANDNQAMVDGDRVTVEYLWLDCSGLATGADACEVLTGFTDGGSVG